jgi:hypothetical protein
MQETSVRPLLAQHGIKKRIEKFASLTGVRKLTRRDKALRMRDLRPL